MPSDRIMWGADCNHAEGIYGATEFTRRCLAEVLAEIPEDNREALVLHYCEDWPLADIARHLGRTPAAIAHQAGR